MTCRLMPIPANTSASVVLPGTKDKKEYVAGTYTVHDMISPGRDYYCE